MNAASTSSVDKGLSYKDKYEKATQENLVLKQQLAELRRLIFGSKSERFVSSETTTAQLGLFEQDVEEIDSKREQITYSRTKSKEKQVPVRALFKFTLYSSSYFVQVSV